MSGWSRYLDRLEGTLDRADACLGGGDLDGAEAALHDLSGDVGRSDLPPLPPSEVDRATALAGRLGATQSAVRAALSRLRPELELLAGAGAGSRPLPRYVDHPA